MAWLPRWIRRWWAKRQLRGTEEQQLRGVTLLDQVGDEPSHALLRNCLDETGRSFQVRLLALRLLAGRNLVATAPESFATTVDSWPAGSWQDVLGVLDGVDPDWPRSENARSSIQRSATSGDVPALRLEALRLLCSRCGLTQVSQELALGLLAPDAPNATSWDAPGMDAAAGIDVVIEQLDRIDAAWHDSVAGEQLLVRLLEKIDDSWSREVAGRMLPRVGREPAKTLCVERLLARKCSSDAREFLVGQSLEDSERLSDSPLVGDLLDARLSKWRDPALFLPRDFVAAWLGELRGAANLARLQEGLEIALARRSFELWHAAETSLGESADDLVSEMIRLSGGEPDQPVAIRETAIVVLGRAGRADERIRRRLLEIIADESESGETRAAAVRSLTRHAEQSQAEPPADGSAERVVEWLNPEKIDGLGEAVIEAAGDMRCAAATDKLLNIIERSKRHAMVNFPTVLAVRALGNILGKEAASSLSRFIKDQSSFAFLNPYFGELFGQHDPD
ncbi:MAG: hypothetical protein N2C14_30665, partial [Planctomycetales bacterium]